MSGILVVCTGNVCRSPMAEGFLRAALVERLGDDAPPVASAGTAGWEGAGATDEAIAAARERGVDIAAHRARVLSRSLIEDADLVVCMTGEHRAAVADLLPEALERTYTIAELVRLAEAGRAEGTFAERVAAAAASRNGFHRGDPDVRDPLGDPIEGYREVAEELEALTGRLADALVRRSD
ncbi:MAG TPA: low molecular weight protein arginine phosphatase [Actinomycetota bacterium]|nr:low molecular weight protein arginine phosphatase [Actinomycetota bacterium]